MFCEKLKELRLAADLTQKQLAEKCGVAQSCIALLEKGRSEANVSTLISLARVFNVSIDYLVGLEDEDGNKTDPATVVTRLDEEKDFINSYRKLNENKKNFVKTTVKFLSDF